MNEWFRSWHGAPTDLKWRTIAKRAGVSPALVVALAWALMDRASQAEDRGCIEGLDFETLADFLDCEVEAIECGVSAMHDKGVLTDNHLTAWDKRQPKRERVDDTAADRKRAQRDREKHVDHVVTEDVTPSHATSRQVTPREDTDKTRVEDTSSLRSDVCPKPDKPVRAKHAYSAEFEAFWREYPTDPNMSKLDAWKVWQKLSIEDRRLAMEAVPKFIEYCRKKPDYQPVYADRFLSKRRFEGYNEVAAKDAGDPRIDFGGGYTSPLSNVLRAHAQGFWIPEWGPRFGQPGCKVPRHFWPPSLAQPSTEDDAGTLSPSLAAEFDRRDMHSEDQEVSNG